MFPNSYLIGEGVDGNAVGTCEAKVGELELEPLVNEQVLRLQVAMEHALLVAELDPAQ